MFQVQWFGNGTKYGLELLHHVDKIATVLPQVDENHLSENFNKLHFWAKGTIWGQSGANHKRLFEKFHLSDFYVLIVPYHAGKFGEKIL